jgi:uncharacterized protein YheU (UPF0270 family)
MRPDDQRPEAIEIPVESPTLEALRSLVEEFVTRDGTNYGSREKDIEDKARDVLRQLERGEARIVFDPEAGSANIATAAAPRRSFDQPARGPKLRGVPGFPGCCAAASLAASGRIGLGATAPTHRSVIANMATARRNVTPRIANRVALLFPSVIA